MASVYSQVSPNFVRILRKGLLNDDGTVKPGFEDKASALLFVLKSLQQGAYAYAIQLAATHGYDLESMYSNYRAEIADAKALGSNWKQVEEAIKVWGAVDRPKTIREVDLNKQRREMSFRTDLFTTRADYGFKTLDNYNGAVPRRPRSEGQKDIERRKAQGGE